MTELIDINEIVSVQEIGTTDDFVYDLENDDGTYVCGKSRIVVHQSCSCFNKLAATARVKYGDTDSIYTQFTIPGQEDMGKREKLDAMWSLALECSGRISETFIKPVELETEYILWPLYLYGKKRYACKCYEYKKDKDVFENENNFKGIKTVRRDNCKLVKTICKPVYKKLLDENNIQGAIEIIREWITKLLKNEVEIDEFVLSMTYNSHYKTITSNGIKKDLPGHVKLCHRMEERGVVDVPKVGDRVPFVYVEVEDKKAKGADRMEDPNYVKENPEKAKIDPIYYLERQIASPLYTIFEIIVRDENGNIYPRKVMKDGTMKISKECKEAISKLLWNDLIETYRPDAVKKTRQRKSSSGKQLTLQTMLKVQT